MPRGIMTSKVRIVLRACTNIFIMMPQTSTSNDTSGSTSIKPGATISSTGAGTGIRTSANACTSPRTSTTTNTHMLIEVLRIDEG